MPFVEIGAKVTFYAGYYAVSDAAVVGLDWWIDVIHGHGEERLGFRRLPTRIPCSITAKPEHFNQHCWACRGKPQ